MVLILIGNNNISLSTCLNGMEWYQLIRVTCKALMTMLCVGPYMAYWLVVLVVNVWHALPWFFHILIRF